MQVLSRDVWRNGTAGNEYSIEAGVGRSENN